MTLLRNTKHWSSLQGPVRKPWNLAPDPQPPLRAYLLQIRGARSNAPLPVAHWTTNNLYRCILQGTRPGYDEYLRFTNEITRVGTSSIRFWYCVYQRWTDRRAAEHWWLIVHRGLPIGNRLSHIPGISEHSSRCPACFNIEQTHEHLFSECPDTRKVWKRLLHFARIAFNIHRMPQVDLSFLTVLRGIPAVPRAAKGFAASWSTMVATMLRCIWLARNDVPFKRARPSADTIWARFRIELLHTLEAICRSAFYSPHIAHSLRTTWGLRDRLIRILPAGKPSLGDVRI